MGVDDGAAWILAEGADAAVMTRGVSVNPQAHPHVNVDGANTFIDWLLSDQGQSAINGYQINGEQAFFAKAMAERRLGQLTRPSEFSAVMRN